jgi:hypothetical protein
MAKATLISLRFFVWGCHKMLSKEQMLKIDPELASLNDEELVELRDTLYGFAQLAFEVYAIKKHGSDAGLPLKDWRDRV